jgi:diadenosine tetraphosphate (Ap4A) HIT family hydrolase
MTAKKGYNLDVARHEEQVKQMTDLMERGVCAFCRENIENEQKEPIEVETEHWVVKKNDYPYENTRLHLLLISKQHVSSVAQLPAEARHDFTDVISQLEQDRKLTSYTVGMRSGDMRFTGSSVEHLHAHLVVGDTDNPNHEPVRFKMSSRPKT